MLSTIFVSVGCSGGIPKFKLRSQRLVGNELRVIIETSSTYRPHNSSSFKTSSVKGWLITVDLSSDGPIAGRARVIGPLWDVPSERSSLSYDAGAHFSKDDLDAAKAAPFIYVETDGTVVKIRPDQIGGQRTLGRDHLVLEAKPYWKLDGPFVPPAVRDDKERFRGGTKQTLSIDGRRYSFDGSIDTVARLLPLDGGPGYQVNLPRDRRAEWASMRQMQLLEKPSRLVFIGTNDFGRYTDRVPDEAVVVFIWDLKEGTLSVLDAPTGELFGVRSGEYVPREATKVE
jgi:hypothetical protein